MSVLILALWEISTEQTFTFQSSIALFNFLSGYFILHERNTPEKQENHFFPTLPCRKSRDGAVVSARLPPMWPGSRSRSRSRSRCHIWVEFAVGSRPCSERLRIFLRELKVFLSPQKPTFSNSNSIRNPEGCPILRQIYAWHCIVFTSHNNTVEKHNNKESGKTIRNLTMLCINFSD